MFTPVKSLVRSIYHDGILCQSGFIQSILHLLHALMCFLNLNNLVLLNKVRIDRNAQSWAGRYFNFSIFYL